MGLFSRFSKKDSQTTGQTDQDQFDSSKYGVSWHGTGVQTTILAQKGDQIRENVTFWLKIVKKYEIPGIPGI